ncbi:mitogen-activated protein kinase kinase kinase 12-like [Galendromus occidentalis]|uniref:Mitogen-activated protein kinase kinase kinase 12-like n=1 Tax=Galendromus occidentalis TaxID=34638 RepID=A0AAJ6VV67_9ACAR|nr:mitogen-activated protein kinase kinase kinase 12-like [Galendromus occidentalis]
MTSIITDFAKQLRKSAPPPSSWVVDPYDLNDLQYVGSGAQGKVFSGHYRRRRIAFKMVPSLDQSRFEHIKDLHHQNLVRFHGVCLAAPNVGFVMDFCSKGTLHSEIYQKLPIESHTVSRWALEIATGMSYLHERGIVHRDLKPLNILLHGAAKTAKIADFDLSLKLGSDRTSFSGSGSIAYMSPEVHLRREVTFRADVWSYGVVLWETLVRQRPYGDLNSWAVISVVAKTP